MGLVEGAFFVYIDCSQGSMLLLENRLLCRLFNESGICCICSILGIWISSSICSDDLGLINIPLVGDPGVNEQELFPSI